jgi:hypothetical protein
MITRQVRITGTIEDVVDVEVEEDATDEEVVAKAENEWRYVEYQDMKGEIE